MSRHRTASVDCHRCGHKQNVTVWDSINATLDRSAKQALVNGQLTEIQCARCRHKTRLEFDCLYHDMEKRALYWLKLEDSDTPPEILRSIAQVFSATDPNYTTRTVRSFPELIEKIRLLDDGLNDWATELGKVLVCMEQQLPLDHQIYYYKSKPRLFGRSLIVFAAEWNGQIRELEVGQTWLNERVKVWTDHMNARGGLTLEPWAIVNKLTVFDSLVKAGLLRPVS